MYNIYTCVCTCINICVYKEATKQVRRDIHVCDKTHSYVTSLIRICIHVTWLMRMSRSTSERDTTDVYGTWLIHTWHDSVWHMNESRASHVTLAHINDRRARGEHSTADEWVQRARGGSTRDRRGTRRAQDLNTLWPLVKSLYLCRTSGREGVGGGKGEQGHEKRMKNQYGVGTKRDCLYHIIVQAYDVGLHSRRHPMKWRRWVGPINRQVSFESTTLFKCGSFTKETRVFQLSGW